MEIPALQYTRTVGTHVESMGAEWEAAYKRGRSDTGKSVSQSEDVMWTEMKVGKMVS